MNHAEALLGALLLMPERMEWAIGRGLTVACFMDARHRALYRLMVRMHRFGNLPDLLNVLDEMERVGTVSRCGGLGYVAALPQACPNVGGIEEHLCSVLK